MIKSNTLKINCLDDLIYISFPNITSSEVVSAYTTRMGGVSRRKYASVNMSFLNGDDPERVKKNYHILFSALGLDENLAVLSHQTHTDNLMVITKDDIGKGISKKRDFENIDGLITNIKGTALVTQFADCVPLLFFDPNKHVVAASHAGWRGTFSEIGLKTVKKMNEVFGCVPSDIKVGIGPSIKSCCYEVDEPLFKEARKIKYLALEKIFFKKPNGKYMLDLQECNKQILQKSGILPENICISDLCTCCHSEYFHSHRATGGNRGNNAAVIALK